MPPNSNKVSQRQFYEELRAVELRLTSRIDVVLEAVHENRTITATTLASLTRADEEICRRLTGVDGEGGAIEVLRNEVVSLKIADKRWGGGNALANMTAMLTALAALLNKS
jgi:hypothetical protein